MQSPTGFHGIQDIWKCIHTICSFPGDSKQGDLPVACGYHPSFSSFNNNYDSH